MAEILPFKALRYDSQKVQLEEVVTQPYDKITPQMQSRYYELSPHNLIRIALGRPGETDNYNFNAYTRAAEYLHDWRASGILKRDAEESIYLYSQAFAQPSASGLAERKAFIALGRLHEYSEGVVFPREQVLAKTRADRMKLLRATRANLGLILMLYSDPAGTIESALKADDEPDMAVLDEFEVLHRVWRIKAPEVIAAIQEQMLGKTLIIADGHHRYDTAIAYRNEQRPESGAGTDKAPCDFAMMAFLRQEAPGVVVLPEHRIVHGLPSFDRERMLEEAARFFDIERIDLRTESRSATTLLEEAGQTGTCFVAVTRQGPYLLRARRGAIEEAMGGAAPCLRQVDVVQLHKVMLERVLGISEEAILNEQYMKYERDASEAISWVRQGANVAFLLNPPTMKQICEIAMAGEILPARSTDFYPNLLSGLTIYAFD